MRAKSRQRLEMFDQALSKVREELASGELDQSGRYYTDEELARGAATGELKKTVKPKTAPAA